MRSKTGSLVSIARTVRQLNESNRPVSFQGENERIKAKLKQEEGKHKIDYSELEDMDRDYLLDTDEGDNHNLPYGQENIDDF